MKILLHNTILILLFLASGCGLLVGNVRPVEEKSENYGILDLSIETPDWKKLTPTVYESGDTIPSEVSDVAYQSSQTSSIISLNSSCRPSYENTTQNLKDFTKLLFMGISDVTSKNEKELSLQSVPALETTIQGKLNGETMMLSAIVLRKKNCIYDLMVISRPDHFLSSENDFKKFVSSLRIKE
jgi:hypothetical protein